MNEPLSTCCGAPPIGEIHYVEGKPTGDTVGICNDCRDHAIFEDAQPSEDEDPDGNVYVITPEAELEALEV